MVESEKKINSKAKSNRSGIWGILGALLSIGIGRAFPLPAIILGVIFYSVFLGVAINKRNVAKSNGEDYVHFTKEIRGYAVWIVVFVLGAGFLLLINGGIGMSQTPAELAREGAKAAKSETTLPLELDDVTTLNDITSSGNAIQYHYTIHDADTSNASDEMFKDEVKSNVCKKTETVEILNKGVDMHYEYTVSDSEQYSFTINQSDCQD